MLEGLTPPLDANLCKIAQLASELNPEDNAILQESMLDQRWSTSALASALSDRGFVVGETALRRHRIEKCKCVK